MNAMKKQVIAVLATLAVGLGVLATAAPASAAGPNVDPNATGTLTIHKHEQPDTPGNPASGQVISPAPANPIQDVVFSITPVTAYNGTSIDLKTNAGWDTAKTAADAVAASGTTDGLALGSATNLSGTDANGVATSAQLPLGVYLVQEVSAPANVVSPSKPFLVTIPLPNQGSAPGWNYDVHVYPKNAVAEKPTKVVDDAQAHAVGDNVTWTITSTIPAFANAAALDSYVVTDNLDSKLSYVPSATVSFADAAGAAVALVSADYSVSTTNPVTVTFTRSGLDKLAAHPGGKLSVGVQSRVVEAGQIANTATTSVNGQDYTTDPAYTTFVPVTITKTGEANAPLQGAVFSVYTAETGGTALTVLANGANTTTFTTGANGQLTIPGLKAGEVYWLEEVTAPNGYQGLTERVRVPATGTLTYDNGNAYTQTITNTRIPAWLLPLTGGGGVMWFMLGGGALVAVAIGASIVTARRRRAASV